MGVDVPVAYALLVFMGWIESVDHKDSWNFWKYECVVGVNQLNVTAVLIYIWHTGKMNHEFGTPGFS